MEEVGLIIALYINVKHRFSKLLSIDLTKKLI